MTNFNGGPDLGWLLERFVQDLPGVEHAQAVSADGFHLAASEGLSDEHAQRFAAVAAGLASLTDTAAETFGKEPVIRQLIETATGWLLVSRINSRASLAVVAGRGAELGVVGYEMTMLAERAGQMLSPELVRQLENAFLSDR